MFLHRKYARHFFVIIITLAFSSLCVGFQKEEEESLNRLTNNPGDLNYIISIDPFYFLAGASQKGFALGSTSSPQCCGFYKDKKSLADIYLDFANKWKVESSPSSEISHYILDERYIVESKDLSKALVAFFKFSGDTEGVMRLDERKRLSFLAGLYVVNGRGGFFNGSPSLEVAAEILKVEGCEIYNFRTHEGVPNTVSFQVKATGKIAKLFAMTDKWVAPKTEWAAKAPSEDAETKAYLMATKMPSSFKENDISLAGALSLLEKYAGFGNRKITVKINVSDEVKRETTSFVMNYVTALEALDTICDAFDLKYEIGTNQITVSQKPK